jgi:hypothetical protein
MCGMDFIAFAYNGNGSLEGFAILNLHVLDIPISTYARFLDTF